MNKAAFSHLLLCQVLRVDADTADNALLAERLKQDDIDWKYLFQLSDQEHMTTAMATTLRRRGLLDALPKAVRGALGRREFMGNEVNGRIKAQAVQTVQILNAAGVTPMLLKGVLHLFEAPDEELCARVLRDIDMVVPTDSLETCIQALRDARYIPEGEDKGWTYQYRPMHHPDHIVGVELHVRPGEQRNVLPPEEAWAEAVAIPADDLKLVALGPTHRIAHNIFHSEIQDQGSLLGTLYLRQLHDLAKICARYNDTIDWPGLSERMASNGLGPQFRARMHMAVELMGAPQPPIAVDTVRARLHLKRCLAQLRWPRLRAVVHWIAGVAGRGKRHHIDLLYGCGTTGLSLHLHRIKHLWQAVIRNRENIGQRIAESGRNLP